MFDNFHGILKTLLRPKVWFLNPFIFWYYNKKIFESFATTYTFSTRINTFLL